MPELDTSDLKALLDRAASAVTPSPDAWAAIDARLGESAPADPGDEPDEDETSEVVVDLGSAPITGRSWNRRRLALAVAAVLVLVAGVVGVLVSRARPDDDGIRATTDRFPMLRSVPDGLQLQGADIVPGTAGSNASVSDAALVIADSVGERGYVVTTGGRGSMPNPGAETQTTVGDRPASLRVTETQASLSWDDGAQSVSVAAFGSRLDEAELRRVAAGVRLARDASLTVTLRATDLPADLSVTFAGPAGTFAPSRQSFLSWGAPVADLDKPVDTTLSLVGYVESRVPAAGYAGIGATRVTVAGRPGYLGSSPMDGAQSLGLTWSPADGVVAMLSGTNLDEATLVRLAGSVELVDEAELRSFGSGWFAYSPDAASGDPTDQVLLAEGVADGIGWRAFTGSMKTDGSEDQHCLVLQAAGNVGSSCGSGSNDGSQGALLQSTQVEDRTLFLVVSDDDIAGLEALDPSGAVVATGVAGTTASGRKRHAWAVVVPSTLPEVRVRATGPGGAHVLDVVQQQSSGPGETRFDPDRATLTAAPTLATGTVDGSPWTLRGAMVPGVKAANAAAGTTVPAPPAPCVVLALGARETSGVVCDGMLDGVEADMGMTAVELLPTPMHAVVALVRPDVAAYEVTMGDGSTRTVSTVEIAGSGGRRAVALVVGAEEHATSLTVIGTDGTRAAPIAIDLTGDRRANVTFGSQGGTFSGGGSATSSGVAVAQTPTTVARTTAP